MDIFDSEWLIHMLAKSSKTPQGRLLSLFDVLHDWINAPQVNTANIHAEKTETTHRNHLLVVFCTAQAEACGAENPAGLAGHIVLIARNAAQQEVNHPGNNNLMHAKKVANALILAQTQKQWSISALTIANAVLTKTFTYGVAASLCFMLVSTSAWPPEFKQNKPIPISLAKNNGHHKNTNIVTVKASTGLTAQDAANMYTKYEQMRNGTCQFPEALQIPDKDKAIYLENVVGGKLPDNQADLAIATAYLETVRCNFTPMLMARSI